MDYETFGEHQWKETGIFEFMAHLPEEILKNKDFSFKTVGEVADDYQSKDVYDAHATTSWADSERDLSAWLSNSMQSESLSKLYAMEEDVKNSGDKDLIERWARLQSSDLFYYMCTKYWSDGVVHKYFSPYNSPYDSYIYFINALADLEVEVNKHSLATARVF